MNATLIFQYPSWFIIFCLLLGAVYAAVLYYKNNFIQNPTAQQKNIFKALAIFRFLSVSIIAFFLLSPFIRSRFTDAQKPEIIILQDASQSIANSFKSKTDSIAFHNSLLKFTQAFSDDYTVKLIPFSNKIMNNDSLLFNGKATNISNAINEISSLYSNQNIGAIVLASDGIYNQGSNPVYNLSSIKFPVYTIAMGDTIAKKDLKIEKVYFNQIVYLGDKFKIAVDAVSTGFNTVNSAMVVMDMSQQKKLTEENIIFNKEAIITKEFVIEATKTGVQHFRVQVNVISGEYTTSNNYKDFFVEVLDSREKILLAAYAAHPDIAALKQAIEQNKNYQVEIKYLQDLSVINFNDYNVAVLHQIPSQAIMPQNIIDAISKSKTSIWFIAGSQSSVGLLNKMQNAAQIVGFNQSNNDVYSTVNNDFALFNITENISQGIAKMPPLATPFGQYKTQPTAKVLLQQKIGSVKTDYPLLAFDESLGKKSAVLFGEGLWRWRLYDYQQNKNHDVSNQFIQQIIQYLSVKEDKRPFKVSLPKNIFNENEPVVLDAELYNQSYQLVNQSEVNINIKPAEGKNYNYVFARSGNGYHLEIGNLPMGNYTYTASTQLNDKPYSYSGKFTVSPLQLENLDAVANHQLLYQISSETGGQLFYPNQFNQLAETLKENQNIKPILFDTFKTDSIINFKWLFFLIIALLSVEWFTRKYLGSY